MSQATCSFCEEGSKRAMLISNGGDTKPATVFICEDCVGVCVQMVIEKAKQASVTPLRTK